MKKVFNYKSSASEGTLQRKVQSRHSVDVETRKRLFRQPKSCPHFSIRIENISMNSDGSSFVFNNRVRPVLVNVDFLLESRVQQFVGNEFLYLNYAVPVHSEFFTPYSFLEVCYSEIDREKYFTISRKGVAMWSKQECHFTPLDIWAEEYRKYSLVAKVKLFSTYRLWKNFRKWCKLIKRQKFVRNRKSLSSTLFLANPRLSKSLVDFRRATEEVQKIQLIRVHSENVWMLGEFVEHQNEVYLRFQQKLTDFYDQVSDSINLAATYELRCKGFFVEEVESNSSSMKFMDRVKKRKICCLICRYLRYIDYMTMNLLYELVLQGSRNFLELIERSNSSSNKTIPAIISIKISITNNEMSITPTEFDVVKSFKEIIDQSMEVVKMKRFEENELFQKFANPLIGGRIETLTSVETTLNIENFFCVDNRLTANRSRIIALATDSFSHLNAYLGEFKKYLLLYSRDLLTDTSDLEKLTDVDDLRMHCARYTGQIKDIKGISAFKNFGIFELDQRCFDEVMSPLYLRLYGKICTHLPVLLSSLLAESNEICQEIMGTLLTPPEGTAGFVDYIYFIERCETVFLEIHDKLTTVDELLELISVYKIDTGEDEELWQRFKTVSEFMVNCKDAHSKKSNQKDVFIEKLSSCIDQDVYQVYREVTEIRAEITKEWILSEDSQPVQVKETLSNALEQLQVSNEKLVQLQSYCEAMELELIDLSVFVDVQVEARVRLNLWESLEEWTNAIQDWYTQSFYQLNTEQMRLVNARVSEHCVVFESTLPENPIAPKLKASVELFKGKIEIISQLRNETLKERHWSVIEELIDRKITEDEEITIKDFEEVGVFEEAIARKLTQISAQAEAEQQIEGQLHTIENFWMEFQLQLQPYRYHRNIFVLANIDEVGVHLDDAFVKMSLIHSSEFVEPIRERVEKWIVHLNLSTDTLSEWTVCQTNWSRLESLFSLPGIEFKIPEELQVFKGIHEIWKETMNEVYENSLALVALLRPGRLNTFQECNKKIAELSSRMDDYFNSRRLNFPRLYFLSNFELMSILTEQPKDVDRIGRYMPKVFDSIFRLKVQRKDIACLLEPVYTITHVLSETGEEVELVDSVRVEGSADQWLKVLEMEMVNTIRRAVKVGFKSYPDDLKEVLQWGRDKLPQVLLVVNRLKIFEEVERYFQSPSEVVERIFEEFIGDLKMEMKSSVLRNSELISLLYTLIYYRDILCRIKSHSIDSSQFNQIWRYKWTNGALNLAIVDSEIPYFNEFLSRGEEFLFSLSSERVFLHFQRTIQRGLNNQISGAEAAGKTSTIRTFGKLVAKFTITFECSEMNGNYADFQRIIFGLVQTGCWAIFRGIHRVAKEILSVIGDQLMLIKEAKLAQSKNIELTGKVLKFNPWSQIFFISNSVDIPESLKIYLRGVCIDFPDSRILREILKGVESKEDSMEEESLIDEDELFERFVAKKVITILRGRAGVGKSRIWREYVKRYNEGNGDKMQFKQIFINSIRVSQLYGHYSESGKWVDGFLKKTFYNFYKTNPVNGKLLIVLDGEVKSNWMSLLIGMNARRRFVTLPNLSLLRIPERVSFVIETGSEFDVQMVKQCKFIKAIEVGGEELNTQREHFKELIEKELKMIEHLEILLPYFDKYFPILLQEMKESFSSEYQSITQRINILVSFMLEMTKSDDNSEILEIIFIFSLLWSLGGALSQKEKQDFDITFRKLIPQHLQPDESFWDIYFCTETRTLQPFRILLPHVSVNPNKLFLDYNIPTVESIRMAYLCKCFGKSYPILFINKYSDHNHEITRSIEKYAQEVNVHISQIHLSPSKCTESIQKELEHVLIPRRKQSIGPTIKSRHIYIIGDVAQRDEEEDSFEFLRQLVETRGYYDRESWNLTKLLDVSFMGVCTEVTPLMRRLTEMSFLISPVRDLDEYLQEFFTPVIQRISKEVVPEIRDVVHGLLEVIVKLSKCSDIKCSFFHLKRTLIGILQVSTLATFSRPEPLIKLLQYEVDRVLGDSIKDANDKIEIQLQVRNICQEVFGNSVDVDAMTIYGNFSVTKPTTDRIYEEITDIDKLRIILSDYLVSFKEGHGRSEEIFWHNHLLTHLSRVCGLIRLPHFHGCLIGGVGKKIICQLAAFINGYRLVEISGEGEFVSKIKEGFRFLSKETSKSCLFLVSNVREMNCLRIIVEILDYGFPLFLDPPAQEGTFKNRIHFILLYDHEDHIQNIPTLQRWCLRYFLPTWGPSEYEFIAMEVLNKLSIPPQETRGKISLLSVKIHMDFEGTHKPSAFARKFLHLVKLYEKLWGKQILNLNEKLQKNKTCQKKIADMREVMKAMQEDLKKSLPQLEERKSRLKEMRLKLDQSVVTCEDIRTRVILDESAAKIQTANTTEITDDVNKDLEIAMPALRAAQDQMRALSKGDWNELKGQNNPAKLVVFVHEAVCILFKIKPDWPTAKTLINEPNFLKKILEFDKENISEMVSKKIKAYIDSKDFDPAKIEKVSKVSKCLCLWVKAIDQFAKVYKIVEPKVRKQQNAEAALRESMTDLRRKQQELADAESKIQTLRDNIEEYETAYKLLQENVDLINLRVTRGHRVVNALTEEDLKWTGDILRMEEQLERLPLDVLLTSATIVYLGEFPDKIRSTLTQRWLKYGVDIGLNMSDSFRIRTLLTDSLCITNWQSMGLPKDEISVDNALIWMNSLRYPLIVDCHEKMTQWMLNIEGSVQVCHHKQKHFEDKLREGVAKGYRIIVEELAPPINEFLIEVCQGCVVERGGKTFLKTRSSDIPYDSQFFLYLITKRPKEEFPEELLNFLNLIDCRISGSGNEEFILSALSEVELHALQAQSKEVQNKIEEDCLRMETLQQAIVTLLSESQGNILDNEEIVAALYETKETYSIVVDRLADSRESEKVLVGIREKYRPIAAFGRRFLKLIHSLTNIDPFYTIPMKSFIEHFSSAVQKLEGENSLPSVNEGRIRDTIRMGVKAVFERIQPSLRHEDQVCFGMGILELLSREVNEEEVIEQIESELNVKLFCKVDFNQLIYSTMNPIVVIPKDNSLENLMLELRDLVEAKPVNFIAVGEGNEEIVVQLLDEANEKGLVLVLQNVQFNSNVVRHIEGQFAERDEIIDCETDSPQRNYKLILIVGSSQEVPKSVLYQSYTLTYYGEQGVIPVDKWIRERL